MASAATTTSTTGDQASVRPPRKTRQGVVTSSGADKTIRVKCEFMIRHAKYGKYLRRKTVIHAHDERNECGDGDRVEVMECRPVSRMKHWRLVRIVSRAPGTRGS